MSLDVCIARLRQEGTLDGERAARFTREFERLKAAYAKTMGDVAAGDAASRDVLDALDYQALQDRRQKGLQILTQRNLLTSLQQHVEGGGSARQWAMAVMDHHEAVQGMANLHGRQRSIFMSAWTRMDDFLGTFNRNLLGQVREAAQLDDVVRALRGEAVENANAREVAAAVADTFEYLRQMFNAAGGAIPKLKNWGLSQSHDAMRVAKAGLEPWRNAIKPLLDRAAMIDKSTGKAFADEAALDEALEHVWRAITSEGMDGAIPGAFAGGGKLANSRSDPRFLIFKDADAWLTYNQDFGVGDVFDAITGHIDSMSRDIAAMQLLGPNPAQTVRWLGDVLRQDRLPHPNGTGPAIGAREAWRSDGVKAMERMWDYYTGALTMPAPENRGTARFFSGLRNWNTSSMLGRAFFAALGSDPMLTGFTAKFNGLSATRVAGNYLASFNPANEAHREAARRAGLVFNEITQRGEAMWRNGQFNVHEMSRRTADAVLRATLLSPHTVAMKQGLGLSFMMDLADHAGRSFDDLDEGVRLMFDRYGVSAQDWDFIRATPLMDEPGVGQLLRPHDVQRRMDGAKDQAFNAAMKLFDMIDTETRFAVPGESLRGQTALALGGRNSALERGTIAGELAHSATQFKTYAVIMIMTHMQRAVYGRGAISRGAYLLGLPIFLTMGGLLIDGLQQISDGKDPSPLDNPQTWTRAAVKGGGFGILGDLLTTGVEGKGVAGYFAGPSVSRFVDPLINLTWGNAQQKAQYLLDDNPANDAKPTNWEREMVREVKGLIPGSSAWYARLMLNRLVMDQLQEMADPEYSKAWKRMEKRAEDAGTQYWWAPGETAPDRAPDLTTIFDAAEQEPQPFAYGETIQ